MKLQADIVQFVGDPLNIKRKKLVTLAKKKGKDIIPLDENEYTGFEIHELSSGDGFASFMDVSNKK